MEEREITEGADSGDSYVVAADDHGTRLDVWVNRTCGWNSRSKIKDLVKLGAIRVNEATQKPSYRLRVGDSITVTAEPDDPSHLVPEDLPLNILFEDATMAVLNKAPYQAVHPGPGCRTGTLVNALAFHFKDLSDVSGPQRPGLVHRLDRDTSGVICVAKNNRAHFAITTQFQERTVEKVYEAIVEGVMEFDEHVVDKPLDRSPANPLRMAVVPGGRPSLTRFEVVERFDRFTRVRCHPKTGRTHQIRVHLAWLGHPILCDRVYGRRARISLGEIASMSPDDPRDVVILDRQALHARHLTLYHPLRGERLSFDAPLAADIQSVLDALTEHRRGPIPVRGARSERGESP